LSLDSAKRLSRFISTTVKSQSQASDKERRKLFSQPFNSGVIAKRLSSRVLLTPGDIVEVANETRYASSESDLDFSALGYKARPLQKLGFSLGVASTKITSSSPKISDFTNIDNKGMDVELSNTIKLSRPSRSEPEIYSDPVRSYFPRVFKQETQVKDILKAELATELRLLASTPDHELVQDTFWDTLPLPRELVRREMVCDDLVALTQTPAGNVKHSRKKGDSFSTSPRYSVSRKSQSDLYTANPLLASQSQIEETPD
jgi:hypothetical protein